MTKRSKSEESDWNHLRGTHLCSQSQVHLRARCASEAIDHRYLMISNVSIMLSKHSGRFFMENVVVETLTLVGGENTMEGS